MEKPELRFKNGKFTVLIMSDIHGIYSFNRQILDDISLLIDREKPSLVLINGDMVWRDASDSEEHFRHFVTQVAQIFESRSLPWAYAFGNHDDEKGFDRFEQEKIYEEFPHCLNSSGPIEVDGAANYVLGVKKEKSEEIAYNIWVLDSHNSLRDYVTEFNLNPDMWFYKFDDPLYPCGGYDTIRFSQIMWYWQQSVKMEKEKGRKTAGLMAFHIPLPQFITVYRSAAQCRFKGIRREAVGCGPFDSGLFNALVERGEVKTVVCGHDHINDFEGELCGIRLAMDGGISYDGYCDSDIKGARLIEINEDDPFNVSTRMVRV